jgi:hypothetical protein
MIKPELWTSRRINSVSLEANLLFIALLNFCDDFGVIPDSNRMILGNCFPFRNDVTEKNIDKWKFELIDIGLIAKIVQDHKQLLAIVKWEKHQTIMNRSKRNYIDNDLTIQQVIETIERLISISLGSNYPIDNRKETIEKRKETKTSGDKSPKQSFGVKGLVKLSETEYQKLVDTYGKQKTDDKIIDFEAFKDFSKYKDHYLTVNKWLRKDNKSVPENEEQLVFEVVK